MKKDVSAMVTKLCCFKPGKKTLDSNLGPEASILVEYWLSSILPDKDSASI
jgi:hypothetical protein